MNSKKLVRVLFLESILSKSILQNVTSDNKALPQAYTRIPKKAVINAITILVVLVSQGNFSDDPLSFLVYLVRFGEQISVIYDHYKKEKRTGSKPLSPVDVAYRQHPQVIKQNNSDCVP
jgi:hypothetical protein